MPEDMDIIPEDENVKRQFASWKVKQENVRFFEQSALNLEMDRLSLKRSEEDLERLRTELGLPVAAGMKFLASTPRMPAPSQTATGGHFLELSVSGRSDQPCAELGLTGQPLVRPNQSLSDF